MNDWTENKAAYDLIAAGDTLTVFQLEKSGRKWAKQAKPKNIEEIAQLLAVIRPGCISGDTRITISNNPLKTKKLSDLFLRKPTEILSINEKNELVPNKVRDIVYSGKKEVFSLILRTRNNTDTGKGWIFDQYSLKCTIDHKLYRSDGQWVELGDLIAGDRIAVRNIDRNSKKSIKSHILNKRGKLIENVKGLKSFTSICYKNYNEKCAVCGWNETSLDVHHIDGNRHTDNSPENLVFLCPNCHRSFHRGKLMKAVIMAGQKNNRLPSLGDIQWVTYIGRISGGEQDTYDIMMEAPYNNFIAGNVVVHNCTDAELDGKSLTQVYMDRKNGLQKVEYIHPALEPILEDTYSILLYQEQAMRIAMEIAGFTESEADYLRKGIGKKLASAMIELREKFVSGCVKTGIVSEEIASQIYDWIEASSRYSFNHCLSLNTTVQTKEKQTTINDLEIGDYVDSPNGYVRVVNKYHNGKKNLVRITLESGKTIECTLCHKFLCSDGSVRKLEDIIRNNLEIVSEYAKNGEKITNFKNIGFHETMDIEVDHPSHIFYGNGIATSNSHAVEYAYTTYESALCKATDVRRTLTVHLNEAHNKPDKMDEIRRLIMDAKAHDIQVVLPDLCNFHENFVHSKSKNIIYYGISHIKDVGVGFSDLKDFMAKHPDPSKITWIDCLLGSTNINKRVFTAIISAGVISGPQIKLTRNEMLFQYEQFRHLTKREVEFLEKEYIQSPTLTFPELMKNIINNYKINSNRLLKLVEYHKVLCSPPRSLEDDYLWIANTESQYLGVSITCTKVNVQEYSIEINTDCQSISSGRSGEMTDVCLGVKINFAKEYKITKKESKSYGRTMAFISVEDSSGELSAVLFADQYEKLKHLTFEDNTVLLYGNVRKRNNDYSLIVEDMKQI